MGGSAILQRGDETPAPPANGVTAAMSLDDIRTAQRTTAGRLPRTPLVRSATRGYGAAFVLEPSTLTVIARAQELAVQYGYTFGHPFDDPAVIAGQGTVGLKILEDLPDAGTVVVPVGGGGLLAGIALAIRLQRPDEIRAAMTLLLERVKILSRTRRRRRPRRAPVTRTVDPPSSVPACRVWRVLGRASGRRPDLPVVPAPAPSRP
jgi:hypothetical protein